MVKIKEISITKIFLLFTIFLTCIFIITYVYFTGKIAANQAYSDLEKQAQNIEKSFSENLEYSSYFMKYLGKQILANNYQNTEYIKQILTSFNIEQKNPKINPWSVFSWITKDKILTNSSGYNSLRIDVSDREYFTKIKDPWKLYLGENIIGRVSHKEIIPGIMQINKGNQKIGYILFGVQVSKLAEKLNFSVTSKNISFAIFDEDKNLVLSSQNFDSKLYKKEIINDFISSNRKIATTNNFKIFSNNKDYGLLKKFENEDFTIFVKYDKKYLEESLFDKIYTHLYFISFLILSLLTTLFFLKKAIIKPILQIAQTSKEISGGNFSGKINSSKIKEINHLLKSLSLVKNYINEEQKSKIKIETAKKHAEKANASKIILLRSITHDIKNYIFGIGGLAKMILDKKSLNQALEQEDLDNISTIVLQTTELNYFVEDLLDTNQIDSGEFNLGKIDYYDVKDLIKRMVILNQGLAIKHRVTIKTEVQENIPPLKCDIRRVKQILTNLITNAIKYNKENGEVKITAKFLQEKNEIYFEIYNRGIGMTNEEINMILSGQSINNSQSNIIDSHGIGMPIVLHLLKLHNAKIEIESKKNIDIKIKLYFNISNNEFLQEKNLNNFCLLKQKHILMVEDNPVNIKITSTILSRAGYKTTYVYNGKEALEILDKEHFDLILMDGEMPVMNGFDTTKTIREGLCFKNYKNFKEVPIIGLMSCADPETLQKSFASGMNYHIEKSVANNKLLDVVSRFLK